MRCNPMRRYLWDNTPITPKTGTHTHSALSLSHTHTHTHTYIRSVSLVTSDGCFPHDFLVLHRELCQLAAQLLVEVQVLGHAAVQAHRLPLAQLCLLVMGGDTLPVTGVGHPGQGDGSHLHVNYPILFIFMHTHPRRSRPCRVTASSSGAVRARSLVQGHRHSARRSRGSN